MPLTQRKNYLNQLKLKNIDLLLIKKCHKIHKVEKPKWKHIKSVTFEYLKTVLKTKLQLN